MKTKRNVIFAALSFFGVVFVNLVFGVKIYAEDSVIDRINIAVPVACTFSGTGMNSHVTVLDNMDSDSAIGETILKAFCNDNNGFAIYAIGYTDNQDGKTVLTSSTLGSSYDIPTGIATSGNTSQWAMKLSTISSPTPAYPIIIAGSSSDTDRQSGDPDFSSFQSIPSTYALVAKRKSATDIGTNADGSTIKTTYQAYASATQPAGTYVGQVKYTMVHPYNEKPAQPQVSASDKICYYANTSTAEGTMGCQDVSSTVTLLASNFSRQGYGFAGWSDKYDYATNNEAHFYGPQEQISIPDTSVYTGEGKGLSLYAVWVESAGNLQDSSKVTELCGTSPSTGILAIAPTNGTADLTSVSALTDQRDNETYAIARLADGNCWMIENLRLESINFDNSVGALAQGYGTSATYGNFSGLADAENANFSNTNPPVANSLYSPSTDGNKIVIGIDSYPYARMPRYNNYNHKASSADRPSNPTNNSDVNSDTNAGMYSYGNYYTWSAALASTIYYSGPTAADANGKTSETVNTSLCPRGWRLPRGGNKSRVATNDFWALVVTGINGGTNPANYSSSTTPYYSGNPEGSNASNKLRAYPNNFLFSGYFTTSSVSSRGSYGGYWSSTAVSSYYSYRLYMSSTSVYPGTNNNIKYNGISIRCMVPLGG